MTLETAKQVSEGTKVREREFGLEGTFVRLCPGGAEIEVNFIDPDVGPAFDFWPRASVEIVETPYEVAMRKEHAR